ncbi:hypothetical protein D0C36_21385 [Mucilaginibacter conchicola]|uniref:Uncharacterized protein n=1 Tax=Mucilaginibacter conchicola TaxID=2303333 RepID=A0A372NNY3_9SPHI|nr:hypothetical protein D0C36_21385 [Mucilaginibacter conchicola]
MGNRKVAKIILLFFALLQLVGCVVLLTRVLDLEFEFINELLAIVLLMAIIYYVVYLVVLILHIKRTIGLCRIVFLSLFCFLPVILVLWLYLLRVHINKPYENYPS